MTPKANLDPLPGPLRLMTEESLQLLGPDGIRAAVGTEITSASIAEVISAYTE